MSTLIDALNDADSEAYETWHRRVREAVGDLTPADVAYRVVHDLRLDYPNAATITWTGRYDHEHMLQQKVKTSPLSPPLPQPRTDTLYGITTEFLQTALRTREWTVIADFHTEGDRGLRSLKFYPHRER